MALWLVSLVPGVGLNGEGAWTNFDSIGQAFYPALPEIELCL